MPPTKAAGLIRQRYQEKFGAEPTLDHTVYLARNKAAALGFSRAGAQCLFVEKYLDEPVEVIASLVFGRPIERGTIVEIGHLAASNAAAMLALWGDTANDLGAESEIAVATLTAPLRHMFARIGMPIFEVAPARAERLGNDARRWGSYYEEDPRVFIGEIAVCQKAMAAWRKHRRMGVAA
ncbi:MAG: thermostable hemolysin [Novosphingobium sp.]